MEIVKKEALGLSEREKEALQLVIAMCMGINRQASNSDLKELACETYDKLCELWGWRA